MVLYYQNRDVKDQGILLDNLKDRVIEDAHAQISIDDTIYFEIHNDPQYIQGRKNLASAVNKCQEIADDSFEWVDMEHLQRAFPLIFDGEDYSKHRLKEWFPAQGGKMDQILQNIVFEEIEYKYSNPEQKVGLLFRLKEGETIQSITEKLNNFEKQVKPWRENLEQKILNDFDSRRRYKRNSRDENYGGGGGGNGNPNSYRPQQQKPTTSNNLRTTGPKMQKAPVSKIFGDSDSDDDARVENARYKANSYVRQKKSPIENTAVTKDTVVVGDASKPGLPKFEEKRFEDYQFIIKKYRLSKDSNLNELFLESMKEQAENNVQEPGSSKVTVSKVEIPAKKVAERVSLSPVLGNQFLNQARRPSYNADKAYTDDDEDEENDGDDDDDSSIASKPSLNAVVKKNQKIGNSSSSSDSENQSAAADTVAATNDLLNTPKETNNKSSSSSEEEENLNKMSEDRSKKPLVSSAGGSNARTPAAAPSIVHQPPKRFEFLTGRFNPSTEIPKSKKEQHRLEREKANGTNVKKEKQMTHQLPKPATTTSPPGATTTPCRTQAESTTTNATVAATATAAAKPVGGFAIPYNIPKTLNTAVTTTATTTTTTITVTAATGERRQNSDMNRREQGHAQEGILRPIPQRHPRGGASPLAPQHSNTGGG
uniref:Uncharacterized protein n=1 Tax=Panagrolaimus sp. ES5 TaxID=591445 RepID=A0AC34FRM8_9BILA